MSQGSPGLSGVTSTLLHMILASQWIPRAHTRETKVQQSHWQEATQAHSALPWTPLEVRLGEANPVTPTVASTNCRLRLARGGGLMG